jgi:hypothetical protein
MAIDKFLATKYTAIVENAAQEQSVAALVTNRAYQVDADGAKSVKINQVGDITIGSYTPGSDISVQELSDSQVSLNLDQSNYFAFYADLQDMAQSQADFMTAASNKAGKKIALTADTYVFGSNTYGNVSIPAGNKFGSIGSSIALTTTNIEEYLDKLATALRTNHVTDGGFCVLPPKAMSLIRRAGFASVTDNSAMWAGRTVAQYAGLTLVESTQVAAAGSGSDEYQILAFSKRAIPMAVSVNAFQIMDAEKRFAKLIKGLYNYGAVVMFPSEVGVLSATIA